MEISVSKSKDGSTNSLNTNSVTGSFWGKSTAPLKFPPLNEDISVDVVVVGGGITGMSTGYTLSKIGKRIAIVDDGNIGGGQTEYTSAHIVNALDDRYSVLEKLHGENKAKLAAESHTAAIDRIESIVDEEQIDCGYERLDGYLFLHPSDKKKSLEDEYDATRRAGIKTEIVDRAPLDSFDTGPCLRFRNQAQFHPLKYIRGLAHAIIKNNGKIFGQTHASQFKSSGIITSDNFRIHAKDIVVATNAPVNKDRAKIYDKQGAYRTYVIGVRIPKGSVTKALYWDTGDQKAKSFMKPYHYVRIQTMGEDDLLMVGGEDHRTGQADNIDSRYDALKFWTKQRFPMSQTVEYRWSGQVMEPIDFLAFIGHNPRDSKHTYIATGDSGNGMTHGVIAGIILTDLIMGKKNKWADLYDPSRKVIKVRQKDVLQERFFKFYDSWKRKGDIKSSEDLPLGKGAIIRKRKRMVAFYKDRKDKVDAISAVCPHLGCIVRWNDSEETFDCPCHGSYFSREGKVINGPSNTDLEPEKFLGRKKVAIN